VRLRFAEPTLPGLDNLGGVCLVLTAFVDDRPLRGLAGHVDWRLNGRLSQLIIDEFVDAHYQEATLTPLSGRLPFQRLLLVGLGQRADYDLPRFVDACRFCFATLARMKVTEFAMSLPGRVGLDIALRGALAGWREALIESFDAAEVAAMQICIIEPLEVQQELVEPMRAIERELHQLAVEELEAREAAARPQQVEVMRPQQVAREPAQQAPSTPRPIAAPPPGHRRGWQSGVVRLDGTIGSGPDNKGGR